jgi:hypothetical protein
LEFVSRSYFQQTLLILADCDSYCNYWIKNPNAGSQLFYVFSSQGCDEQPNLAAFLIASNARGPILEIGFFHVGHTRVMSNESIEENKKQKQKIVVRAVHCNIKIKQIMAEIEKTSLIYFIITLLQTYVDRYWQYVRLLIIFFNLTRKKILLLYTCFWFLLANICTYIYKCICLI